MKTHHANSVSFRNKRLIIVIVAVVAIVLAVAGLLLKSSADATALAYEAKLQNERSTYLESAKKLRLSDYLGTGDDTSQAPVERGICDDAKRLTDRVTRATTLPASPGGFLSKQYQEAKKPSVGIPLDELARYAALCNFYVLDTERRYEVQQIMDSTDYKALLSSGAACNGASSCIRPENYAKFIPFQEKIVAISKAYYEKQQNAECPFEGTQEPLCAAYRQFEKDVYELWAQYLAAMRAGDSARLGQVSAEFRSKDALNTLHAAVKNVEPSEADANVFYKKQVVAAEQKIAVLSD